MYFVEYHSKSFFLRAYMKFNTATVAILTFYLKSCNLKMVELYDQVHWYTELAKKRGHRLMTIILSNLNRFKKIHLKIP